MQGLTTIISSCLSLYFFIVVGFFRFIQFKKVAEKSMSFQDNVVDVNITKGVPLSSMSALAV